MAFEQQLQNAMFSGMSEKTFIDKLLAKEDSHRVKDLITKKKLSREDLLELLYLLSGTESKLVNYSDWDRYVILKFFVWVREFIKVAENLYDYQDDLTRTASTCAKCEKLYIKIDKEEATCKCEKPTINKQLSKRTQKLIFNNERNIEHAAKFLIDLYFNIARTTLSLGGTGFIEMLKNKFEISYPQGQPGLMPPPPTKPRFFGFGK